MSPGEALRCYHDKPKRQIKPNHVPAKQYKWYKICHLEWEV